MNKLKALFRDIKIALEEAKYLPDLFKRNKDDHLDLGAGEYSVIDRTSLPGVITSTIAYLMPFGGKRTYRELHVDARASRHRVHDEQWFFINGVTTTEVVARMNASAMSQLFSRPITVIYNPTKGLRRDLGECILGRTFDLYSDVAYTASKIIADHLRKGKRVVLVGHSQGGIIIGNIVELLETIGLKKEQFALLEVYTFAGAQDTLSGAVGHSEHFANECDYVARIGIVRRDKHIDGTTYVRKDAVGHLLNENYLGAFSDGKYCGGTSRLFSYSQAGESNGGNLKHTLLT